jgi:hypothetical protein
MAVQLVGGWSEPDASVAVATPEEASEVDLTEARAHAIERHLAVAPGDRGKTFEVEPWIIVTGVPRAAASKRLDAEPESPRGSTSRQE